MASVTNIYRFKMISIVYRTKSDNGKKARAKKVNFRRFFLETDQVTTLTGIASEKKKKYPDGKRAPSKFINHCKFLEEYYDGMPASDIVNHNAQFLLGIEEAVRTTSIFKIIPFSILGLYASNHF